MSMDQHLNTTQQRVLSENRKIPENQEKNSVQESE